MIKVAAIGTEGYAYTQLERIFSLPEHFELVGVCSEPLRRDKGYELCRSRGVDVFDASEDLLRHVQGRAQAVFIFTGIDSHCRLTRQCLWAGFEVFLEKPPVPTIQQLDELAALEQKTQKRVAVLFQYLYSRIVQTLKRRLVSGEFGRVIRVRSMAAWQRPDDYFKRADWSGVLKTARGEWVLDGTLNNPLSHVLGNSLFLASLEADQMAAPRVVQAELYRVHDIESEDTSSVRIICENGCVVTNNMTLCSESQVRSETVVECEKAVITYLDFNRAQIRYLDSRPPETLEDMNDHRIHMLIDLADTFRSGKPYKVSLKTCRPFTLCVNGAFDSSGSAIHIDPAHVIRDRRNGTSMTLIKDIEPVIKQAHKHSRLLSEIQIPWARSGCPVQMKEYTFFPGNREENSTENL